MRYEEPVLVLMRNYIFFLASYLQILELTDK